MLLDVTKFSVLAAALLALLALPIAAAPAFAAAVAGADTPVSLDHGGTDVFHLLTVTTTADGGPGSVRDTIARVNQLCGGRSVLCRVIFEVPHNSSFEPLTPLPPITACGRVQITGGRDGVIGDRFFEISGTRVREGAGLEIRPACTDTTASGGILISGLAINSFPHDGVSIHPTGGEYSVTLHGMFIGTDMLGTRARPNGWRGVAITSPLAYVEIAGSVVSGNGRSGVWAWDAARVRIGSSLIGVGTDGRPLGNGASGVFVFRGFGHIKNTTIAHNAHWGATAMPRAYMDASDGNSFYSNGVLGIDWGVDFHTLGELPTAPAAPVITSATYDPATNATTVRGTLEISKAEPGDRYHVRLYSSSSGNGRGFVEGERYESETTGGFFVREPGTVTWQVVIADRDLRGRMLTAVSAMARWENETHTASEFSLPVTVR